NAGKGDNPGKWLERLRRTGPWDHGVPLPVRIILRDFAAELERSDGAGENPLLAHLQNVFKASGDADFWPDFHEGLLDPKTSYLILLDGLDEAPTLSREAVNKAIDDFAHKYHWHRYLVTCRIYAYVDRSHQLRGFQRATLTPFSEEQIKSFISAWYGDLSIRGRFSKKEAADRAEKLKLAATRPDLIGLAERPLLLTVMALLHTFRGQLPDDRVELYQWTVDLLLRRWESRVSGEDSLLDALAIPGLKMSNLEAGLFAVAYHVHSGVEPGHDAADIREEVLRKELAPFLDDDWNKAGRFVKYIRERAGLLIRHKPDAYTFPHRTFQEFMAACHMAGMKDYPSNAARITREDPDRWRIVFILAAGRAARTHRPGDAISSVNFLCPSDANEAEHPDASAFRLAQIAAEALLEIGLVGV
ncbi:MAG: hypothetical protein GY859_22210, partial [Desulfobacterales bacterium]|nr:hypothetical protein [Desulfobacterales bacterium]